MKKNKTNKEVTTEAAMLVHKKRAKCVEEKIKLMRKN